MEKVKDKGIIGNIVSGITTLATEFYNRLFKQKLKPSRPSVSTTSYEIKEGEEKEETSGLKGQLQEQDQMGWLTAMYYDDNIPREYKEAIELLVRASVDERVPAYYRRRINFITKNIRFSQQEIQRISIREYILKSQQYNETLKKAEAYADNIRRKIKKEDYTCAIVRIDLTKVEFVDNVGVIGIITVYFSIHNRHNNKIVDEFEKEFDFVIPMTKEEYVKYY